MKKGFVWAMSMSVILMWGYLLLDYFFFRHQGARFTARNGQELCERVQRLDGNDLHLRDEGQFSIDDLKSL